MMKINRVDLSMNVKTMENLSRGNNLSREEEIPLAWKMHNLRKFCLREINHPLPKIKDRKKKKYQVSQKDLISFPMIKKQFWQNVNLKK